MNANNAVLTRLKVQLSKTVTEKFYTQQLYHNADYNQVLKNVLD